VKFCDLSPDTFPKINILVVKNDQEMKCLKAFEIALCDAQKI
jgi:hypothetical protein